MQATRLPLQLRSINPEASSIDAAVSAALDAFAMILSSPDTQRQCRVTETEQFLYVPRRRNSNVVSGLMTSPFISNNG